MSVNGPVTGYTIAEGRWGLFSFGNNGHGQLGNNSTSSYSSPIQVGALTNWKTIAGGSVSWVSAGIKTDGTLWMWGQNTNSQLGNGSFNDRYSSPIQVGSLTNWEVVSIGAYTTHAIKSDGTLWGWGNNSYGQLGDGTTNVSNNPKQIGSLTDWHTLSLQGYNNNFAIKKNGTLWAWGRNNQGQLGNSTLTNYSSPIQIGALTNWKQISCSYSSIAAVKTDGTLWTWGSNLSGQLGNNTRTSYSSPIQVGALTNWNQVYINDSVFAAVKTDGTLWTCGYGDLGALGNGSTARYSSPIQVGALTNWKAVSLLDGLAKAIKTDGTLWTWGYGLYGTGNSTQTNYSSPIQIGSLTGWTDVRGSLILYDYSTTQDLGKRYVSKDYFLDVYPNIAATYGARKVPNIRTWGLNDFGQLGNSTTASYSSPIQIGALTNWRQVSIASKTITAVKTDGTMWGWGYNEFWQLGINDPFSNYSSPIQIGALTDWKRTSAGSIFCGAIREDGSLYTWGDNYYGQLGSNNTTTLGVPTQVGTLTDWRIISCGYQSSAAVKTNGTLWAWGRNNQGQLGNSTNVSYSSPIQIGALTTWSQVATGQETTFAIKTDGTLWAWGRNQYGQLGNSTTTNYSSPIQVGLLTTWYQVAPGLATHAAAVKTDGTLWTWGFNSSGQLGISNRTSYSSPVQVGSLTNWKQVAATAGTTFCLKTDGTLWSWGVNTYGQLGNNTRTSYSSPVQVGSLSTWKQVSVGEFSTIAVQDGYI